MNHVSSSRTSWLLSPREQRVASVMSFVAALFNECGVEQLQVRVPFFHERAPEAAWLSDGTTLSISDGIAMLAEMVANELALIQATTCMLQGSDDTVVRPYWDGTLKVLTAMPEHRLTDLADRQGVDIWRVPWGELDDLSVTPYRRVDAAFGDELLRRQRSNSGALLTELWAHGPIGRRAQIIDSTSDVNGIRASLRPRSVVLLIDSPDLVAVEDPSEDVIADLDRVPPNVEYMWHALAILPGREQYGWSLALDAEYWFAARDDYPELYRVTGPVPIMPAMRWYREPLPARLVMPDADGVVRSIYRDGPDSALG